MNGLLVHTTLYGKKACSQMVRTGTIGKNNKPGCYQFPAFANIPLVFCSYVSKEYPEVYSAMGCGLIFETDALPIYACPADSWQFMRGGKWLPGHERFIFPSIEEMLANFPSKEHFKKEYQKYFRTLKPKEVYNNPYHTESDAKRWFESDYCLKQDFESGYAEIAFPKPLRIKNCRVFRSREELEEMAKGMIR